MTSSDLKLCSIPTDDTAITQATYCHTLSDNVDMQHMKLQEHYRDTTANQVTCIHVMLTYFSVQSKSFTLRNSWNVSDSFTLSRMIIKNFHLEIFLDGLLSGYEPWKFCDYKLVFVIIIIIKFLKTKKKSNHLLKFIPDIF